MTIDFTLAPEHEEIRPGSAGFIQGTVMPAVAGFDDEEQVASREEYIGAIFALREKAQAERAVAAAHAQGVGRHGPRPRGAGHGAGRGGQDPARAVGPQLPGARRGQHAHAAALGDRRAEGEVPQAAAQGAPAMSCFAMTEPEVAGSDPTLIRTHAVRDGDEWVINGHKWFISNARRCQLRHPHRPDRAGRARGLAAGANTAFLIDLPPEGWNDVREVETMHGSTGHSEIVITTCGCTTARSSAGGGTATGSASTVWARLGWPTACAGSPRPRPRST